jgi:hypothetical protein
MLLRFSPQSAQTRTNMKIGPRRSACRLAAANIPQFNCARRSTRSRILRADDQSATLGRRNSAKFRGVCFARVTEQQQSVSRLNYFLHKVEQGEERPQTDHRGAMFTARVSSRGWQGKRARLGIVGQVDVPDRPQENSLNRRSCLPRPRHPGDAQED